MTKPKNRVQSLLVALALLLGALSGLSLTTSAATLGYCDTDVAAINRLIDAGQLPGLGHSDPANWEREIVEWGDVAGEADKRIIYINFSYQPLTGALDLRELDALKQVYLAYTKLSSVNLAGLDKLGYATLEISRLTTLDVSGCTSLTQLYLNKNPLTELTIPSGQTVRVAAAQGGSAFIDTYDCSTGTVTLRPKEDFGYHLQAYQSDQIASFDGNSFVMPPNGDVTVTAKFDALPYHPDDLAAVKALFGSLGLDYAGHSVACVDWSKIGAYLRVTGLSLSQMGLTGSMVVPALPELNILYCFGNELTALDVSACANLTELHNFDNPIGVLDLRRNTALDFIDVTAEQVLLPTGATINLKSDGNGMAGVMGYLSTGEFTAQFYTDLGYALDHYELTGATLVKEGEGDSAWYWFQMPQTGSVTLTAYSKADPYAVSGLTATPGDKQVALKWSAPTAEDATPVRYMVEYIKDGDDENDQDNWTQIDDLGLNTACTITGLTNGQPYIFDVAAVYGFGADGDYWEETSWNRVLATPVAPEEPGKTRPERRRDKTSSTPSTPTNRPATKKDPVSPAQSAQLATDAVAKAKAESKTTAVVRLVNESGITLEALQAMVKAAGDMPLKIHADIVVDGTVVLRLSFDPSLATKDLDFTALLNSNLHKQFTIWFDGQPTVVRFSQPLDWGMPMEISLKLPENAQTDGLVFYSYDQVTNTYKKLNPQPEYKIDANGYLVFTIELAGDLVINNGELVKS